MLGLKFCRICLEDNVRMHQISGSEVQDVYEKLINEKVQEEGRLHYACYICYRHLKNCQQLVIKSQKSEELLNKFLQTSSAMHLKSVSFLDRLTYGLTNSLMVAKLDYLKIPDYKNILKIENQCGSDSNEVMVKYEPLDDSEFQNNDLKLDGEHDFEQDKIGAIESRKENTFATKINLVANENKSSQIGCDEIYNNQLLINSATEKFICNVCGITYSTKALLIKHISGHKPVNKKQLSTFIIIPKSICLGRGVNGGKLKNDFETHMDDKLYKCQYCDYTANKTHLERHIRTHTGEKPFKCKYCNYSTTLGSSLKVHVRIHTGEKPFKCKYCNYTSALSSGLKRHIRTHTGEKPFKCQYCSYTSAVSSHLKVHIRTHTGENPFKCQYCSYTCKVSSNLKVHIRTHTGENPFKCQYCSYTSSQSSNLKAHIRTHTGEKPFKCQYCSYTCAISSHLNTHMRNHTEENPFNVNTVVIDVHEKVI